MDNVFNKYIFFIRFNINLSIKIGVINIYNFFLWIVNLRLLLNLV